MSTRTNPLSQPMLHIASVIASHGFAVIPVGYGGCSVPGCCGEKSEHTWTYTIGLVERGQPELVLLGLDPVAAHHGITWVADQANAGCPVPIDTPLVFDRVGIKLVDVPGEWLAADLDRMAMWFNHYAPGRDSLRHPDVRQLVWADAQGRFPDDPLCDPKIIAMQPILSHDPHCYPHIGSHPRPNRAQRRSMHRY